jgi:hypothetical protein
MKNKTTESLRAQIKKLQSQNSKLRHSLANARTSIMIMKDIVRDARIQLSGL